MLYIRPVKPLSCLLGLFMLAACGKEPSVSVHVASELPAFDTFWNIDDPAGTEAKFRDLLQKARQSGNQSYTAELMTQVARAQGLQQKFEEARATLDEVDALLKPEMKTARVRSVLERGRVLNSSGKREES